VQRVNAVARRRDGAGDTVREDRLRSERDRRTVEEELKGPEDCAAGNAEVHGDCTGQRKLAQQRRTEPEQRLSLTGAAQQQRRQRNDRDRSDETT
jgi:hypothetical protein